MNRSHWKALFSNIWGCLRILLSFLPKFTKQTAKINDFLVFFVPNLEISSVFVLDHSFRVRFFEKQNELARSVFQMLPVVPTSAVHGKSQDFSKEKSMVTPKNGVKSITCTTMHACSMSQPDHAIVTTVSIELDKISVILKKIDYRANITVKIWN